MTTINTLKGKNEFPFSQAARVRMLVLDVDGVLTDGRVIMLDDGQEAKGFNVRDGHGIKMLQRSGVQVAILTGRKSQVVANRAMDLGIQWIIQGCLDKNLGMQQLCEQANIQREHCAYMGDDVVDLPAMRGCALSTAPADAHMALQHHADWCSSEHGGHGAVRELAEGLILARECWYSIVQQRYAISPEDCGWPELI